MIPKTPQPMDAMTLTPQGCSKLKSPGDATERGGEAPDFHCSTAIRRRCSRAALGTLHGRASISNGRVPLRTLPAERFLLAGWSVLFIVVNHVYFILFEEPGLERRFGKAYTEYRSQVPRWLPRLGV